MLMEDILELEEQEEVQHIQLLVEQIMLQMELQHEYHNEFDSMQNYQHVLKNLHLYVI